jgi:hypothetical protein
MEPIRIVTPLTPELLQHPQLRPLLGKTVEIVVREEPEPPQPVPARWQPLQDAAGKDLVDPEAYRRLREVDLP